MGDRTTCTLTISGFIAGAEEYTLLASAIRDANGEPDSKMETTPTAGPIPSYFTFWEVNHAQLDGDLETVLDGLGLAYIWSWNNGDDYPEGVTISDTLADYYVDETTSDGDFFLTLEEAESQEGTRLAELKAARDVMNHIRQNPTIYSASGHDILKYFSQNPERHKAWQEARETLEDAA